MHDDTAKRLARLTDTARQLHRTEQELVANLPPRLAQLAPVIAHHPTLVETANGPRHYHVKPCWWRSPPPGAAPADFHGLPPKPGTPGVTVAPALCRDSHVLTSPDPALELIEIRFVPAARIDDESLTALPTPPNDFAYEADRQTWNAVALELPALITTLEITIGQHLRRTTAARQRLFP